MTISCARVFCDAPATLGGIVIVDPNGLTPTHAIYYACDRHGDTLATAVETWPVAADGGVS